MYSFHLCDVILASYQAYPIAIILSPIYRWRNGDYETRKSRALSPGGLHIFLSPWGASTEPTSCGYSIKHMLNKQAKGCESQASLPKNSLCACSVDSSHASVLTSRTTDSVAYFTKTSWTISNGNSKMFRECKNTARVTNCGQCLDLCHERRSLIFFKQENKEPSPSRKHGGSTPWAKADVAWEMKSESTLSLEVSLQRECAVRVILVPR